MAQTLNSAIEENSPRSTILAAAHDIPAMNGSGVAPSSGGDVKNTTLSPEVNGVVHAEHVEGVPPGEVMDPLSHSPNPQNPQFYGYPPHLTPQPIPPYSIAGYQQQGTPLPGEAPAPGAGNLGNGGSFFQQPSAAFAASFGGQPSPLSPPRPVATPMGVIPPASPIFPRLTTAPGLGPGNNNMDGNRGAPQSPTIGYAPAPFAYPTYSNVVTAPTASGPDENNGAWNERSSQQPQYPTTSPQIAQQVVAYGPAPSSRSSRAYSFEGDMLPPPAHDQPDQGSPVYSPYSTSTPGSTGGTLFAHQPWYAGPPDMYGNTPPAPLQPRPMPHIPIGYPGPMTMRSMPPYGQFYQTSSPGPPIQTTASNKGPDGANLFIFHIPNHFTNIDMYQLFCPYGNLLSVRIMVEKDSGRSRGFGFVSYDSPESAALAIKELNGFAIGNKRLKVQHKQIRPRDMQDRDGGGYGGGPHEHGYPRNHMAPNLPPAGPSSWAYDKPRTTSSPALDGAKDLKSDENTDLTSTSTGAETPLGLPANDVGVQGISPLSTLGALGDALPDVTATEIKQE